MELEDPLRQAGFHPVGGGPEIDHTHFPEARTIIASWYASAKGHSTTYKAYTV